jgi:phage-related tail fiber protein
MGLMESRWLKKDAASFVTTNKSELEIKLNTIGALEKTVDGINIKALGIVDAMLAGSISTAKLAEGADFIKRDGSVAMTGMLTLPGAPTSALHAATKSYVDAAIQGLDIKASCRVATTGANITLSGLQTIDGVSLVAGDRVLVKDQTNAPDNGIYVVSSGAWTRATDADANEKVTSGMYAFISEGTANHGNGWVLITPNPITLGTTALTFTQFNSTNSNSLSAGNGLIQNGNTIDVGAGNGIAVAADSVSLGTLTTDWDIGGNKTITNVKDPVNNTDVVNKQWVIANSTKNVTDKFTYNGSNASFTLSAAPKDTNKVVVIISGAPGLNSSSDYSVSVSNGTATLTLDSSVTSAMNNGDVITAMYVSSVS